MDTALGDTLRFSSVNEEHKRSSNAGFSYLGFFGLVIVTIVGAIAIPHIKPWSIRSGITSMFSDSNSTTTLDWLIYL